MSTTAGLRERKKAATRECITRVALDLARKLGPDAVTVDAIAAAADVAPRTVFNYFATKEDAILGLDPNRGPALRAFVEGRPPSETALEAIRAALVDTADDLEARADDWATRLELIELSPALQARYVASFTAVERELTEAVRARGDDCADMIVATALTAMRLAVQRWQATPRTSRPPLVAVIDEAFGELAAGFARRRRPESLKKGR